MKRFHHAMVTGGLAWLGAVLWLVASHAIAREIRPIRAIADFLDKLPTAVSTPIFIVGWFVSCLAG